MKTLKTGLLIAVEGIDGSGKSTLARALTKTLGEQFITRLTFEPGDSPLGKQLRELLQQRTAAICDTAEYLLFAADRAQHTHELIKPLLAQKSIVISDRMADSSLAYQGYGRGLDTTMITSVNTWALQGLTPNITLYVKISLATSLARLQARNTAPTAFEQEKAEFTQRVLNGFETIYKNRSNVVVLDGEQTPATLLADALAAVNTYITTNHLLA